MAERPVAVTGGWDATVRLWDLTEGTPLRTMRGHDGPVSSIACTSVSGRPVAVSASDDHRAIVWHLDSAETTILDGHTGEVACVACTSLSGRPVAVTASKDRTIRVWDLAVGATIAIAEFPAPLRLVACVQADGTTAAIVTNTWNDQIYAWDILASRGLPGFSSAFRIVQDAVWMDHHGDAVAALAMSRSIVGQGGPSIWFQSLGLDTPRPFARLPLPLEPCALAVGSEGQLDSSGNRASDMLHILQLKHSLRLTKEHRRHGDSQGS